MVKGKEEKKSRKSARLRELTGISNKPRLLKDVFGPILAEFANCIRIYDSSYVKKFDLLKSRGYFIEASFLKQSWIFHGLLELLVNSNLLKSSRFVKH